MKTPLEYGHKNNISVNTECIEELSKQEYKNKTCILEAKSNYGFFVAFAIIAILLIVYIKNQQSPVEGQLPQQRSTVDYTSLIQVHSNQAAHRNMNAMRLFEMDLSRVRTKHQQILLNAANDAAEKVSEYKSLSKIIYYLALDKVNGKNDTEAFLDGEIKPFLDPAIQDLAYDVGEAVNTLAFELRSSTVQLAADLATSSPNETGPTIALDIDMMSHMNIEQSLRNLGINTVGNSVAIAFDIAALSKSQIFKSLLRKLSAIAGRTFGKQVAGTVGSIAIAGLDGPLPVGDIIALGGIIWTVYDIHDTQKDFKSQINTSLNIMLTEAEYNINEQAIDKQKALVKEYQNLQNQIGSQTLDQQNQ